MVVISIISLFSSIAFASFATVRVKAQEATIKSDLKSIKSQAEIAFNSVGDYSTASSAVSAMIEGINKSGGTAAFYTSDNTHYAVSAKLNSDPTKSWSVSDVSDNVVWQYYDQTVNANGDNSYYRWNNAIAVCSNAGQRLPTIEELKALFDAGGMTDSRGFTNNLYWSSTPDPTPYSFKALAVHSIYGYIGNYSTNNPNTKLRVRCVF